MIPPQLQGCTHMHRPISLLHVIRGEEVGYTGELVEETILKAVHGRRPHNGSLGEDGTHDPFSPALRQSAPMPNNAMSL